MLGLSFAVACGANTNERLTLNVSCSFCFALGSPAGAKRDLSLPDLHVSKRELSFLDLPVLKRGLSLLDLTVLKRSLLWAFMAQIQKSDNPVSEDPLFVLRSITTRHSRYAYCSLRLA